MDPFIVCTLSRSRTRWLAELLTFRDWTCHCEVAMGMRQVGDIARFFARPRTGTTETAAAPGWDLLRHYVPAIRGVVVRRPVEDAIASMSAALTGVVAFDAGVLRRNMQYGARALDRMARSPGVLTVEFADLEYEDACAAIFEHCLGVPMPHEHWAALRGRNIQVNVKSLFDYYERNQAGIEGFKRVCRANMHGLVRSGALRRAA
jgi:hypothetical protein